MAKSSNWAVMIGASLLAIGFSAGCGQIPVPFATRSGGDAATSGQVAQVGPTAGVELTSPVTPTPLVVRPGAPHTVPVVRDSITETLTLDGTVAPQERVSITYPGRAIVSDVKVTTGALVKQGDVLLEVEGPHHQTAEDITALLDTARTRLVTAQTNLVRAAAQADVASGQQAALDEAAAERQQQAIADAASGVRHAQDNLAKVQAGASALDKQSASTAVDTAVGALQKAQDTADRLAAGPDPDAIRSATRDVTTAQVALSKAQGSLDLLTRGPDPTAVRQAQGLVVKAQTQLQLAQTAKPDPKIDPALARIQQAAAIQDAQLALDTAQAGLVTLKLPPSPVDVQAARQNVQDATDAFAAAQARLDAAQAGPDQAALDAAGAAVANARQAVAAAQKNLSVVNSHPTPSELADAQDQVQKAQAALDAAHRAPAPTPGASVNDLDTLQAAVDQSQAEIDTLQQTFASTQVTAPADGTIVAVRVKIGDVLTSTRAAIVLARPGPPVVSVDLTDDEAGRLTIGQPAAIQIDAAPTSAAAIEARVATLTPASPDGSTGAIATLGVTWPDGQPPKFGYPVQVSMTLQQKQGVLVVPMSALHISGSHATVEVLNGTLRRLVTVEVGIRTRTTAEILSGLSEGQLVLAGTS